MSIRVSRRSYALAGFMASCAASCAAPALAIAAALAAAPLMVSGALALTQDVTLENIKIDLPVRKDGGGSVSIKSAVFTGTNLSKDEVAKFFSISTTQGEVRALAAKMTAAKISIPEIAFSFDGKDGNDAAKGIGALRGFEALKVEQGKTAKLSVGGGDVLIKSNDAEFVKGTIGAYEIADADFSALLSGLMQGDITGAMVKYSKATFAGADFTVVDKATPAGAPGGNLMRFKMGPGSAAMSFDGDVFRKASGEVASFSMEFPKASQAGQALTAFGYDRLDIGFKVAASYDPATKKMAVDDYTITGVNAGALTFKGNFGSLDPSVFAAGDQDARLKALMAADFSSLSLRFANSGLAEKGFAFAASMQKKSPDALKTEISGMAKAVIPGVLGADAGKKIADALAAFIASPKNLSFDVKAKGGAMKFTDIAAAKGPQDVLPKVDLSAAANQ